MKLNVTIIVIVKIINSGAIGILLLLTHVNILFQISKLIYAD